MKYRPTALFRKLRCLAHRIDDDGLRNVMLAPFHRGSRYFRRHGLIATLKRMVSKPQAPARPASETDTTPRHPDPFDLLHGTDTGGLIWGKDIPAISISALYSTAYIGISPAALTQALSALPIRCEEFTFVDVGCGKGRALMVAAQFPFRQLLGIEIAGELCEIAKANVATDSEWAARISILKQDAVKFSYPEGPLLIFLFNPFRAPVLRKVLKNLERQLGRSPRPTYLLYAWDPGYKRVMESFPFLRVLSVAAYPFSAEETSVDPFKRTEETFTLYCSEITC